MSDNDPCLEPFNVKFISTRAEEPKSSVLKTANGKISFARGIHYPPSSFIPFARPASLYREEYVYVLIKVVN
jgi:hypothetical protein